MKCPVCGSEDIVQCHGLPIPNAKYNGDKHMWERYFETKMCNDCKYMMMFYLK